MHIIYNINAPVTVEQVIGLFRDSGIQRPIKDPGRIKRMLENANLILTAWDGEHLVGIARCLTDFSYCCYLSDLAVHRDYQRMGIGTELIKQLQQILGDEVMILLLAAPAAMDYYPKLGFEKANNAWLIPRKR